MQIRSQSLFLLSAFLICELLLREREAASTIAAKRFYVRRILRIWPLYYLGLVLGLVFAFLPGSHTDEVTTIGWYAIFMGAWRCSFFGWTANPVLPLWSISVEEQFYLLSPWAVKCLSRRSLFAFCGLLILISNSWLYYLGSVPVPDARIWADSFVQFECFAAGILVCLILRGRTPLISIWRGLLLIATAGACWFIASYWFHSRFEIAAQNPGSWYLIGGYSLGALGSVLLLLAFLGTDRKLLPGWAIYHGRISFGLYVYHEFAKSITTQLIFGHLSSVVSSAYLLKGIVTLGLTVFLAALSYRFFETPFLKMKKRYAVIESQS